jgi:uncharacterized membrane protein
MTAVLLAVLVLLAVPAPAISAQPTPPGDPHDGDGEDRSSPQDRAIAKWTYLLYMSADNNLEDEAILNFNQMEEVGSSEDLNIVLQLDRSPEWDETNGNWTGTRRYLVLQDTDTELINSQLLEDMGEVDMGAADNLRDFVVWGVANYPAQRYYLDIWGHGGGWRDGTCNDYTSGSVIDTVELGQALRQARARTNVTMDGLGFDQCLMAQLEVFYQIKQYGDVLVGAETLIPADGYNYTRVLLPLAADPDMNASELGDVIVTAFFDEYGHDNERAHSAVDAEMMDAHLAPALTRLAQLLRANASSLRTEIQLARDYAQTYSTLDYIDLGNFTEYLLLTLPQNETELRQAVIEVRQNVSAAVVAEDHGIGRPGSTGLTFYFPRYGISWSYGNIQMSTEGRWDEFLDAYFDRRDRPNEAPNLDVTWPLPGSVVGLEFPLGGTANDTDGNVTFVEWKFDRGPWLSSEAGDQWHVNVSTAGVDPGLHRFSVRARSTLFLSTFGEEGGPVDLEVVSAPTGWSVGLPFTDVDMAAESSANGTVAVNVDAAAPRGSYQVIIRAWATDAPLIQAFTVLTVDVTDRWADLVVEAVTIDPEDPEEGELVMVGITVRNTGLAPAVGFDVEVQYRFEPGVNVSTQVLAKRFVDQLAVGETLSMAVEWTATIGTHEFIGAADGAWNNTDLDRTDNTVSRRVQLLGYAVMFDAFPGDVNVTPGEMAHFSLLLGNDGNLPDTLVLSHVNSTLGWSVRFNSTLFLVEPRQTHEADMWVHVPTDITGGNIEWVTLRLASSGDLHKYRDITLSLLYPEAFAMEVSQDKESGTMGPLATDSFNVTIMNGGNGFENYTLEYIRQLDHLFVSAVVDTVEVAPGGSATVEVFFSTLDTDVGGRSLVFDLRARSRDDPTTVGSLSFNVTVARVFHMTGEVTSSPEDLVVVSSNPLMIEFQVTSHGNYATSLEVHLAPGQDLFDLPPPLLGDISPGSTEMFSVILMAKQDLLYGRYEIVLAIQEAVYHFTISLTAEVEVTRVDSSSLRVKDADASMLGPGVSWNAELVLRNDGNHVETYIINASFAPDWLLVEFSDEEVTLGPYSETRVEVTVWLLEDEFDAPPNIMLVVNANPANQTDGVSKVVLDIVLDVPPPGTSISWWMVAGLMALTVVVLVLLVFLRQGRLRS